MKEYKVSIWLDDAEETRTKDLCRRYEDITGRAISVEGMIEFAYQAGGNRRLDEALKAIEEELGYLKDSNIPASIL